MDVSDEERPDESFVSDEDADNELLYLKPEEELLLEQARMMRDALDDSYYQAQANNDENGRHPVKFGFICHLTGPCDQKGKGTNKFQFHFVTKHRIRNTQ